MDKIEQRQKKILQNQVKQEKYIDRLGDLYENLYEQQTTFNHQYMERVDNIKTQLKDICVNVIPPQPPRPPYRAPPY